MGQNKNDFMAAVWEGCKANLSGCLQWAGIFIKKTLCTLSLMNVKLFNKFWPFTKSYQIINNYVLLSHLLVIDNDDDPVNYLVNVLISLTFKLSL